MLNIEKIRDDIKLCGCEHLADFEKSVTDEQLQFLSDVFSDKNKLAVKTNAD
tara:strand:- start:297 stop:452 length:156 start_codon:yes stop_codon:yes gene_type:complete